MKIFALNSSKAFGEHVADSLKLDLSPHEERVFEDGEHKFRPLTPVRGKDAYVIQSLFGEPGVSVNDKLAQVLFFAGALRDAGAARVTAVTPYLAYSRKDRRTKPRDPLTTQYIAQLFEGMGVDAVMTIDVHNISAFENAFRCDAICLDTRKIFGTHLAARIGDEPAVVASPDPGGVKRAQLFREMFEKIIGRPTGFAFLEKRRTGGTVTGDLMAGEVADASVIIIDDLISTGGTMARAAQAFRNAGARKVYAVGAHGLFVGDAGEAVKDPNIEKIIITDTVPPFRLQKGVIEQHIEIVSAAPLVGEAIRRLHQGGSITELLEATT